MVWADYIETAVQLRRCEFLEEDGKVFCHIPELRGVWVAGPSIDVCIIELREGLVDWIQLGIEMGHTIPNLPSSDGSGIAPSNVNG